MKTIVKKSKISGKGLFASELIKKGEYIDTFVEKKDKLGKSRLNTFKSIFPKTEIIEYRA